MKRLYNPLIFSGLFLITISICIVFFTFYPLILAELKYEFRKPNKNVEVTNDSNKTGNVIHPVDDNFGIVIPKIDANSKVIENVDPNNSWIYQHALTQGVAHAKGSALPNQTGNVFIFSHSSVNPLEAARYNSVFYLLSKLEKGDNVYLFYEKEKYQYKVIDKKVVSAGEISYLQRGVEGKILTLMTCSPPGTSFRRLIVKAEQI